MPAAFAVAISVVSLAACGGDEDPPVPPRTEAPSPTEGVDSAELAALLVEHWDIEVALDPFGATFVGDHRVDAQLPPVRRDVVLGLRARRRALLAQATALDAGALTERDRLTLAILVERLTADAGLDVCDYERWAISTRNSLVGRFDRLGELHPLLAAEDAASYRARIAAMPAALDVHAGELAAGAAAGLANDQPAVQAMISRLRGWAARAPAEWPMVAAVRDGYLSAADRDRLVADVTAVIAAELAPAYHRLADRLAADVVPLARRVEGLVGLPAGRDCYAAEIRRHTTLPMTAAELHALGQSEVARVEGEILALGGELYGVDTLSAVRAQLDGDASLGFRTEDEILGWVDDIIARARDRVAPLFAGFPAAPLDIVPYPAEFGQVAASYRSSPDGVQPAQYFLVTRPPQSQSRWAMEATTYHEAIPGHHLQVGRATELTGLPALRVLFSDTAYVEGWGLYAETLAGEIDLYTSGAARLGRLANEALRACRLVIDTGLHDLGWTRTQAIAFMEQHSLFAGPFVAGEIERYLATPGQALAYKVGELELLRLRAELRTREGDAFSLRDFHEAVLEEGSLPLAILADKLLAAPLARRAPLAPLAPSLARRAVPRTAAPRTIHEDTGPALIGRLAP
jgi:uncharacterized protein (DUF885 family)